MPEANDAPTTEEPISDEQAEINEAWDIIDQPTSDSSTSDAESADGGQAELAKESTDEVVTSEPEATSDNDEAPKGEDSTTEDVDISWAPAELKDRLQELKGSDPASIEGYRAIYTSMQGDYTRKTQDVADQRKELETDGQYADIGKAILATPEGKRRFAEYLADPDIFGADAGTTDFDYADATSDEIDEHVGRKVSAEIQSRATEQATQSESMKAVENAFIESAKGVDAKVWEQAYRQLDSEIDQDDFDLIMRNPSKVARYIDPIVKAIQAKNSSDQSKSDNGRAVRASSPSGVASVAPKTVKKWVAEKRQPTSDELAADTIAEAKAAGFDIFD